MTFSRLAPAVSAMLAAVVLLPAGGSPAAEKTPHRPDPWWLAPGLRVLTYEFLERGQLGRDLSDEEILGRIEKLGGCDLVLIEGFHYWQI